MSPTGTPASSAPPPAPAPASAAGGAYPAPADASRARGIGWLLVLLALLAAPKLLLSVSTHDTSIDGGLYTEIARHVARGEGLVTNVSLYHHGYPSFPHPTAIYPIWPLVYGFAARFGPLPEVGIWLATSFYFTSLLFAFAWGRSLDGRELFPAALPGVHLGHVMALALGLHREYFEFTSWPYTEGLAWTLLMATLWRANRRLERPGWAGGVELGLLSALAFLTRSQLLLLPVALGAVLAWESARDRPRRGAWLAMGGVFALVFVLAVLPEYLYVRSFVAVSPLWAMLRFDGARVSTDLAPVEMMVRAAGPWDTLVDRLGGLVEAYRPGGKYAYTKAFGALAWALPLALLVALVSRLRRRPRAAPPEARPSPRRPQLVLAWVLAILAFVAIHAIHKQYYLAWNFARRQALTSAFVFVLALRHLARRPGWIPRAMALVLLLAGAGVGYDRAWGLAQRRARAAEKGTRPYKPALVGWLDGEAKARGGLVVAMTAQEPQKIAWRTEGVGYHWFYRRTRVADLRKMVEELGVTHVLVGRKEERWGVLESKWFERTFVPVTVGGRARLGGMRIYEVRDAAGGGAP